MRLAYLFALCLFIPVALLTSCKKEKIPFTPTVPCDELGITLTNLGANPIDSVKLTVNDQKFDSTFINPSSGFDFKKEFCGGYSFNLKFYHVADSAGWSVDVSHNNDKGNPIPINGDTELTFIWDF